MTRLPVISSRKCVRALEKAGFYVDRQRDSHIIMLCEDPPARVTVPQHRALRKGTLRAILRESGLSAEELVELL